MTREEIHIGETYVIRVNGREQYIRIDREDQLAADSRKKHGGWLGTNVRTGRPVAVRSARRFLGPAAPERARPDDGVAVTCQPCPRLGRPDRAGRRGPPADDH